MLRTQNNRAHPLILVVRLNIEKAHTTQTDEKEKTLGPSGKTMHFRRNFTI